MPENCGGPKWKWRHSQFDW